MSIFDEMETDAAEFRRAPSDQEVSRITELGLELVDIEAKLERWEAWAKEKAARKTEIQMRLLVDAMDEAQTDRIGLPEQGVDLELGDYYKAGLPNPETERDADEAIRKAALRARGVEFLREDAPDLLSTIIVVSLPAGQLERAREIVAQLTSSQGYGIEPGRVKLEEGVHWATLTAWLKEQVRVAKRDVAEIPLEALGATIGRIVKIVKRRKKD